MKTNRTHTTRMPQWQVKVTLFLSSFFMHEIDKQNRLWNQVSLNLVLGTVNYDGLGNLRVTLNFLVCYAFNCSRRISPILISQDSCEHQPSPILPRMEEVSPFLLFWPPVSHPLCLHAHLIHSMKSSLGSTTNSQPFYNFYIPEHNVLPQTGG